MPNSNREYPAHPIPCAAAILLEEDRVLLIRRGREPNYGQWSFPGGAVELGETSRECAAREAKEETGLDVEILEVAAVVDREFRAEDGAIRFQYVIIDYLAKPVGGTLRAADDVLEAAWVPFNEAFDFDLAPPTGDVLRKALDLWRQRTTSPDSA
ncbi:MAG: NUDIX hydrolase [Armatimonadetes bacterium]|nr:NUDIX hydrolase [Armatimonadota bacterium]